MINTRPVLVFGYIMMGGLSRRFHGVDKSHFSIDGRALFEIVVDGAKGQVTELALGLRTGQRLGNEMQKLPVLTDIYRDIGPMAGLHIAMSWADQRAAAIGSEESFVATFACDTPKFPGDMVARLYHAMRAKNAKIALPRHNGRIQTALGLWSAKLLPELILSIEAKELALTRWAIDHGAVLVDFDNADALDFFNINTPQDAAEYQRMLCC